MSDKGLVKRQESTFEVKQENNKQKIQKLHEQKQKPKNLFGHWNLDESQRYYVFLTQNKRNFEKKALRRTQKIFKEMSKFVRTRTADQCRSHHQKMEKKYVSLDTIYQIHEKHYQMNRVLLEALTQECRSLQKNVSGSGGNLEREDKEQLNGYKDKVKDQRGAIQQQRTVPDMSVYYENGYYVMPIFILPCSQNFYYTNSLNGFSMPNSYNLQHRE